MHGQQNIKFYVTMFVKITAPKYGSHYCVIFRHPLYKNIPNKLKTVLGEFVRM